MKLTDRCVCVFVRERKRERVRERENVIEVCENKCQGKSFE